MSLEKPDILHIVIDDKDITELINKEVLELVKKEVSKKHKDYWISQITLRTGDSNEDFLGSIVDVVINN